MRRRGSITVFLALSFVCIAALLLGIAESARTSGARFYMQVAADSAMESLFSQYHRKLWEDYRILALEYLDGEQLREEYHSFLLPYTESGDWYPMKAEPEDIIFPELSGIAEDVWFEQEILEYMKYGFADSVIRFLGEEREQGTLGEELTALFDRAEESEELREIQERYQLGSRDLSRVEDAIRTISERAEAAEAIHADAAEALGNENDRAFLNKSDEFRRALERIKEAVEEYQEAADRLAVKVVELRADFEGRKGGLSQEAAEAVEAEIAEYESYVLQNGEVRRHIAAMPEQAERLTAQARQMDAEVRSFEEWVSDRLSEQDDEEDYYDYSSEIAAFYSSAREEWQAFSLIRYEGEVSRVNPEIKNALDRISDLLTPEMLRLVLPEDAPLPSRSKINASKPMFYADTASNPLEKVLLGEYAFRHFHYWQEADAEAKLPASGCEDYELEYLICGRDSNYENLSALVFRLVVLREGMNLIHLMTDQKKRGEARAFVTQLLCITANPALIMVLTFFVLGIWALGQAIYDVKQLLGNGRVPLFHTEESWTLDLEGLLQLGKSGKTGSAEEKQEKGMSYKDYLRVFLYGASLADQKQLNRRMLTRIQNNINTVGEKAQNGFVLSQCLYGAGVRVQMEGRHVMYGLNLLQMFSGLELKPSYEAAVESFYSYGSERH